MKDKTLTDLHRLSLKDLRSLGLDVHCIHDARNDEKLAVLMSYKRFLAMGNEILRLNDLVQGLSPKVANER